MIEGKVKKWLRALKYLIAHAIKPTRTVHIGAVCAAPGVWPAEWALISSYAASHDRVIKNLAADYALRACPSEHEGGIYNAVPVRIPTHPANRGRHSHRFPCHPTRTIERCTLHRSHTILHKTKRNVQFKNRNLMVSACLICCSHKPAPKAYVQSFCSRSVDLRLVQTIVRWHEDFFSEAPRTRSTPTYATHYAAS